MIIKSEPALDQDIHDIQPPPEYSETLPRPGPEPTPPQRPTPAARPQYPPQPSPRTRDNLTPQQREVRIGQEYRDRLLAQCANGEHDATTTFGICGIICAVLLFPIGLLCLCVDNETKCSRCGARL
ncbi:hypothetical protein BJ322DRAFT_1026896 [Thelephora terrestris]|uniref:Membrane protein BRI3 n=1 Tax=Thelephora terrestris TaxID=56493 RepID=A0A9P6HPH8_9AGAM|nr:hypothetical protein BJ322DRAFT_1026896 [Thelephora terrestris]